MILLNTSENLLELNFLFFSEKNLTPYHTWIFALRAKGSQINQGCILIFAMGSPINI
jgi:hypothetical protein